MCACVWRRRRELRVIVFVVVVVLVFVRLRGGGRRRDADHGGVGGEGHAALGLCGSHAAHRHVLGGRVRAAGGQVGGKRVLGVNQSKCTTS